MKKIFILLTLPISVSGIFFSCKKETSCEDCKENNKPPIAMAGPDQVITLPTDSVLLDGRSSSDPDGTISEWLWKKIEGPASFNIVRSADSITMVKDLLIGVYKIELKVTDDKGLSGRDTIQVTINDPLQPNRPPIANAGPDQTITPPTNSITLNGSSSSDPDNNIVAYHWTMIAAPPTPSIVNSAAVLTQVTDLVAGVYLFKLKVTDAGGLFSEDTMQVAVGATAAGCGSNRPVINAQLIPVGNLSQTRSFLAVASVGNKILFAGGAGGQPGVYATTRVDIYDISTQSWSTAELSAPRWDMATVTVGNKVFFGGGAYYDNGDNAISSDAVEIYDASTNQWTTTQLSGIRHGVAAATVGDKVFFAGGQEGDYSSMSDKVDIYNLTTNTWSSAVLSQRRKYITAVTASNKIYFAGGNTDYSVLPNNMLTAVASNHIDVYDHTTNSWSVDVLNESRYHIAGIIHNNKLYWAGGWKTNPGNLDLQYFSCQVETRDPNTQVSSISYLNQPRSYFTNGGQNAVVKNNKIVFLNGGRYLYSLDPNKNKFDIYDPATNTWYIGLLPLTIEAASVISVNNTIYVAGGMINGAFTNQVWKLEF